MKGIEKNVESEGFKDYCHNKKPASFEAGIILTACSYQPEACINNGTAPV